MTSDSPAINALGAIRVLHSAGGALFDQLALHGQLAQVEWVEDKESTLEDARRCGPRLCLLAVHHAFCRSLAADVVLGDGIIESRQLRPW